MPYGSLIVELANYVERRIVMKRDKNWHTKWWAEFPMAPADFNPCKVLQTDFHPPAGPVHIPEVDVLRSAGAGAHPAILKPFVRAEWKVLSRIAAQTDRALYEQEGL